MWRPVPETLPAPAPLPGVTPAAGTFEGDTVDAVRAVRDAFVRMVERSCPGSRTVTDICRAFNIHRKLAWQVTKVAYSDDPFVAARHMPSGKSLEVWLEAARASGVPAPQIEAARLAADRFESLTSTHAANRDELEMLLQSCGAEPDAEAAEKWRERSFAGNSFVWGARCKVLLAIVVLAPSEEREHYFHAAQVRGLMGFRQTRAGVRWLVNQSVVADDQARTDATVTRVPLDQDTARLTGGVPVIGEFSSQPLPRLKRRGVGEGLVNDEFVSSRVGLSGERTLVTGEVIRNLAPVYATDHDKVAHFGTAIRTPAELLHFDLFVRAGLFGNVERELRMFSDLGSPVAFDAADVLPTAERISKLGRGVSLVQTPEIPGYADLAAWVFNAMGVDSAEYELFRVRMKFPPMPATVMVRHELPAPPPGWTNE